MTFAPADINRLMDNARVQLPGALDGAIQLEIFNTLNDFFQVTNVWFEDVSFAVSAANTYQSSTTIVPSQGLINRLIYVTDSSQIPRRMVMSEPGELMFIDVPSAAETWLARVALTVTDPIPTTGKLAGLPVAPAWVLAKYNNAILEGVLARMMAQIAKPYSNAKMAQIRMGAYVGARSRARSEAQHQNVHGGQTWRYPSFASGRRNGQASSG